LNKKEPIKKLSRLDKVPLISVYNNDALFYKAYAVKTINEAHTKKEKKVSSKDKNLKKIQEELLTRKKFLEEELANLHTEKNDDGQVRDSADQALSAIFETLKNSLQNSEFEEYKMIVKALEMIDKGEYGACTDCEQPISEKRLQSYPNAARCLSCQEILEESGQKNNMMHFL